jgi:hypothetical protein
MNTDQLLTHAQKLLALHGKPDASGYTGDRRIVWIGEQPRFTTDVATIPAYQDAYIKAIALLCAGLRVNSIKYFHNVVDTVANDLYS